MPILCMSSSAWARQSCPTLESCVCSRSRPTSRTPSSNALDTLGSDTTSSEAGSSPVLRQPSPPHKQEPSSPRKSPLSKRSSMDEQTLQSAASAELTFSGMNAAQWGLQLAEARTSQTFSEVSSADTADVPTASSAPSVLQQWVPIPVGGSPAESPPQVLLQGHPAASGASPTSSSPIGHGAEGPGQHYQQQPVASSPEAFEGFVNGQHQHWPQVIAVHPGSLEEQQHQQQQPDMNAAASGHPEESRDVDSSRQSRASFDDDEPAMHHPLKPTLSLSEEQQRARMHPYPHDVIRSPPAPHSPGRGIPPRSPMSRLGRSASTTKASDEDTHSQEQQE